MILCYGNVSLLHSLSVIHKSSLLLSLYLSLDRISYVGFSTSTVHAKCDYLFTLQLFTVINTIWTTKHILRINTSMGCCPPGTCSCVRRFHSLFAHRPLFILLSDENQKMLMTCPVSRESIVHLLTSEHVAVRKECLALLCLYSQMPHRRRLAIDNLNVHM